MNKLISLSNGYSIFYIMTRLWDYTDKIKSEKVEKSILKTLSRFFHEHKIPLCEDINMTFVPFRDSSQETIDYSNKTKIIYQRDMDRLKKLFAVAGFYDGLAKDEGVSFEIGYAYGTGVPIFLLRTDFIWHELDVKTMLFDPVIEAMASKIIYRYQIPDIGGLQYTEALAKAYEGVFEDFEQSLYAALEERIYENIAPLENIQLCDVYIDFGGGQFEWERNLQNKLIAQLCAAGYTCTASERYTCGDPSALFVQLGMRDIDRARSAKIIVTCADHNEMNGGSAAIQGMARAMNKTVVLYDSRTIQIVADGQYRSSRNLMIDFSADAVVKSANEIIDVVKGFTN